MVPLTVLRIVGRLLGEIVIYALFVGALIVCVVLATGTG